MSTSPTNGSRCTLTPLRKLLSVHPDYLMICICLFQSHIVNSGANWETVISIDEHPLWVYAADSSYIEPQKVDAISIPMGERHSIFIKLDKLPGTSFTIVSVLDSAGGVSHR